MITMVSNIFIENEIVIKCFLKNFICNILLDAAWFWKFISFFQLLGQVWMNEELFSLILWIRNSHFSKKAFNRSAMEKKIHLSVTIAKKRNLQFCEVLCAHITFEKNSAFAFFGLFVVAKNFNVQFAIE